MNFKEFKDYFETIKNSAEFKKVDEFTHMTSFANAEDVYENIKKYLGVYHKLKDSKNFFEPDYDYLVKFLKKYLGDKKPEIQYTEKGAVDLQQSLYLSQPAIYFGHKGSFVEGQVMFTDGKKYVVKTPLNQMGKSGVNNPECRFCGIIGSNICKTLEVDTANINIAFGKTGYKIISENFLKPREEIITAIEETEYISEYINRTQEELTLRKYPQNEIKETIFQYKKQEFVSKLIGLQDQKIENTPLIHYVDKNGKKHIKMAPMMDFDYSFHLGNDLLIRKCDNEGEDLESFILQFQDDLELMNFIKTSILKLNMNELYKKIYEETGLTDFKEPENFEKFTEFVENNLKIARDTIARDCRGIEL